MPVLLDISGKTLTAGTPHCQKETCRETVGKGGRYVLGLKENQKTPHDDAVMYFSGIPDDGESFETFRTLGKNAGRREWADLPQNQGFVLTRRPPRMDGLAHGV